LIAAKLSSTAATIDETATACTGCALAIDSALTSGDKGFSQALVVGNQVFVTADSTDVNLAAYGSVSNTGHVMAVNLVGTPSVTTVVISAGASSLVNLMTALYNSSSTQQQLLTTSATTTVGPSVDSTATPKLTRAL